MIKILNFLIILIAFCSCSLPVKEKTADSGTDDKTDIINEEAYTYQGEALRIGVVGLVHDHVGWILGREKFGDSEIVGIVEPNQELATRYCKRYGYPTEMVFSNMEEMLDAKQPEAVAAYNSIFGHLEVVEFCAPRGIHVMVEKPLATNIEDAEKMLALANNHNIHLITNYETSWYGSNSEAYNIVHKEKKIGDI